MLGVLSILFGAGILYHLIFGVTSRIVLGITIVCGVGLVIYIIRFTRDKLRFGGSGDRVKHMSLEGLKDLRREIKDSRLDRPYVYRPGMFWREPKVVSTEVVICTEREGEPHRAVLLIREDGTTMAKCRCRDECYDCVYEDWLGT